jgi:hypothetical protein
MIGRDTTLALQEATGNAAAVASVISPFRRKSFNTWTA